jgi:hypothetical protein
MKLSRKQIALFFAAIPFVFVNLLFVVPNATVNVIAIILLYLFLLIWLGFGFFFWVRWIARTAEKAGRSYVGFMIFGIFLPVIASIVVLILKPEKVSESTN